MRVVFVISGKNKKIPLEWDVFIVII